MTDVLSNVAVPVLEPGSLHLRVVEPGASRSHTMDLAMVAKPVFESGGAVLALVESNGFDFMAALGCGWHDRRCRVRAVESVLDVVGAWFRATADGSAPVLFIEQLMSVLPDLDPGSTSSYHMDRERLRLLDALQAGDERELFELCGLDRSMFLRSRRLPELPKATVVAGVHRRRDAKPFDASGVMGGALLVQRARSVWSLGRPEAHGDLVVTDGRWLKHRDDPAVTGVPVRLMRERDLLAPWRPV